MQKGHLQALVIPSCCCPVSWMASCLLRCLLRGWVSGDQFSLGGGGSAPVRAQHFPDRRCFVPTPGRQCRSLTLVDLQQPVVKWVSLFLVRPPGAEPSDGCN